MKRLGLFILVLGVLGVAIGPRLMLATHVAVAHGHGHALGPGVAVAGDSSGGLGGSVCGSSCCSHGHGGSGEDGSGDDQTDGDGDGGPGEPCEDECAGCELLSGLAASLADSPEVGVRSWGVVGRLWVVDGRLGALSGPRSVLGRGPPLV